MDRSLDRPETVSRPAVLVQQEPEEMLGIGELVGPQRLAVEALGFGEAPGLVECKPLIQKLTRPSYPQAAGDACSSARIAV